MTVTVVAGGRYVTDLTAADFSVYEDGVLQDVAQFSHGPMPIALALLLDTSASMDVRLPIAQDAAVGFARSLRAGDAAEIIDFDSRVTVLQPFTEDADALERAIRRTAAGGSTSLYNAVYIALKDLKRTSTADGSPRRQAVVLLSDGEDTSSLMSFDEVLDLAKRSDTAIYAIGLRDGSPTAGGAKGFHEAEFALRQLAQETGGRAFFPADARELSGIYASIAEELASQYTLGFSSRNSRRDGAWRRLVVRVARDGATARTRQGYVAATR